MSSLLRKIAFAVVLLNALVLAAVDVIITQAEAASVSSTVWHWRMLAIFFAASGIALLLAWLLSRSYVHRVTRLKQMAASGLESESFAESGFEWDDELGSVANSLNAMAARTRELVNRLSVETSRQEAILSSMTEGLLAVDHDLRVIFCNESFARLVGAPVPLPKQMQLLELVRDHALRELLISIVRGGPPVSQHLRLQSVNGRSFQVRVAPLATSNRPGALAVLHDVTDLERLENVRKDFVINVAHELRTPLAAIYGCAETLLDGAVEDPISSRRFLQIIQSSAERLTNIVSDLSVLSQLESGVEVGPEERFSIREALDTTIHTVEAEARLREVTLVRGEIEDFQVNGCRTRLEQAVLNLLMNAIKFNRPGGQVRIDAHLGEDRQARIAVSDTGIGIPFEDIPRIFERFYRVDKGRSRRVGGTGLGLSIVKHAVERMRGTVGVESRLGKGSTFTISLPAD